MQKFILFALVFAISACQSSSQVILSAEERKDRQSAEAFGQKYAIATQGKFASLAAREMYTQGGNIIDAAVAASFAISVERPQSTGLGGGGFMMFREAKTGKVYAIDFRERAPLKATKNMYVKKGRGDTRLSQDGALAVAVPGLVAGLVEIHQRFGSLPLEKVIAPAIDLAEKGFPVYEDLRIALADRAEVLRKDPEARRLFLDEKGEPWPLGHQLVQKDLAATLRQISARGAAGFYQGAVAEAILKFSRKNKGILTSKDFQSYKVKWREPVQASYKGYEVYSMPPPSSGGVHVIQFLKFLEGEPLRKKGLLSADSIHLAASALQSAFADRAKYLGDPDFVQVPVKGLIADDYIQKRYQEFSPSRARKASEVSAGNPLPYESTETTHLSLMDVEGNAISSTQTINGWMGAAVVAPGTGVVLNNEMDDFSIQEGVPNLFGAIGGSANAIAPQKTPLSSMSPTILVKDGQAQMSVGAPGGTRIISCVAQTILNYVEFQLPLYDAVTMIRYHQQWQPDVLFIDPPGPRPEVLRRLKDLGYQVKLDPVPCNVMAVTREGNRLHGVADPRDIGTSAAY